MRALPATVVLAWMLVLNGSAEIIDRLVAVVNRQVITLGDVQQAMKAEQLEQGSGNSNTQSDQHQKLNEEQTTQRLIDQLLIHQQLQEFPGIEVSPEEIDSQIGEMMKSVGGPEAFKLQLQQLNTNLEQVQERVRWQLQVMKFIDSRFRQFVAVDQREIQSYYFDRLLPDLKKRGIQNEPPLTEVEEKIRDLLTEEKLNVQVEEWMASLRTNASIQIFH